MIMCLIIEATTLVASTVYHMTQSYIFLLNLSPRLFSS